jgi:hypothetical protein
MVTLMLVLVIVPVAMRFVLMTAFTTILQTV